MTDRGREIRRLRKSENALRALIRHGNPKAAADSLGIHPNTLRRHVADYCVLRGFTSEIQAAYALGLGEKHHHVAA